MFTKYTMRLFILIISVVLLVSCLKEPDYLDTEKTDLPEPSGLMVEQLSAFSLQLSWSVPEEDFELADGFLIEGFSINDSIYISSDSLFDSRMDIDNNYPRTILLLNTDSVLVDTIEDDTTMKFIFVDDSATFNSWNYYRVTVMFGDIKSYSVLTHDSSGHHFRLNAPDRFEIEQLNDYQLKLSWDTTEFADGYKIERWLGDSTDTSYPDIIGDTLIDLSYDPNYEILTDTVFTVYGVQPNLEYIYEITAYAVGYERRESDTTSTTPGKLSLNAPVIEDTMAVNSNTIRLYLPEDSLVSHFFDTLFVLRNDGSKWSYIDTLIIDAMEPLFYDYSQQYLIDDKDALNSAFYKLVAKGKVNALASNSVIASPLPLDLAGFTFVEGGEFPYSVTGNDTNISSYYMSIYEFTGTENDSFPSIKGYIPVDSLSWVNAVLICSTLTSQYENEYTFRLPSEAEWEYAAKWDIFLQQDFDYPWRSNSITGDNANYMNSGDSYDNGLTPSGYYDGNNGTIDSFTPFGIYDMGGNILEWCGNGSLDSDLSEVSGNNYIGENELKVLRGGGYWHSPEKLKATEQFRYEPDTQVSGFGFRIIMEDIE